MIHAYAATQKGAQLAPYNYPEPPLSPGTVEVSIDFCGLCHSDIHLIDNDWGNTSYPFVPGHEIVGRVSRIAPDAPPIPIGTRVGIGWQCGACFTCASCLQGDESSCTAKIRTCFDRPGGCADRVIVDHRFAFPIPEPLDSAEAAPLLCAGITTYTPFKRHAIQPFHAVAVVGIGGLGHLALQFGRAFGCDVTAISHSPHKAQEAISLGANRFTSFWDAPPTSAFDFVLATSFTPLSGRTLLSLLKPRGTLCLLGLPSEELSFPIRSLVSGNRTISGSSTGNRHDMLEMLQMAVRHRIRPRVEVMPMDRLNEAVDRTRQGKAHHRIVLSRQ